MHYHYIPQMPGDGTHAYCEDHISRDDLQDGTLVYVCDCTNNTCVVCEENDLCVLCRTPVLILDSRVTTKEWTAHMECIARYGRSSTYGKVENSQT